MGKPSKNGDKFLYAAAAAVPSLGAGITAHTYGFDFAAWIVGAPAAAFLVSSTIIAILVMWDIVLTQILPLAKVATGVWNSGGER